MSSSEKFLFGDDFSIPEEVRIEKKRKAEEPVVPMFTEDQVAQIKAAAFDEGRQSGIQESQQNAQSALNQIMQQLLDAQHQTMSYLEQIAQFHEQEAIQLAHSVASKIAPHAVARFPLAEIESLIHECLDKMHSEPRMIIRINTELMAEVEELVENLSQQAGFEGRILMRPDPSMALPDVQIEWTNGGVSRSVQDLIDDIDAIVSAYMNPQPVEPVDAPAEDGTDAAETPAQQADPQEVQA